MTYLSISAQDGSGSFQAYHSAPAGSTKLPAIVVIQEIFGVNVSMRQTVDAFAEQGFLVAAPDLFWRMKPGVELDPSSEDDRKAAFGYMKNLNEGKAVDDIQATAEHLLSDERSNGRVAVVGYCLGGKLAYLSNVSKALPAVSYYGVAIDSVLDQAKKITAPMLVHIAEQDELCKPDAQERIRAALANVSAASVSGHPEAGHAFARPNSPAYVASAAERANAQTYEFLNKHLVA